MFAAFFVPLSIYSNAGLFLWEVAMARKKWTPEQAELYGSGVKDIVNGQQITPRGWQYITSLADVVIHRYYRTYDVEDLISLVVVDAGEFLLRVEQNMDSGAMVPKSIRNVLFTRMRNVASNYLYKLRRMVPVSSMAADGDTEGDRVQPEPSFWPSYAIDALPHRLWECTGAEGGGVVSLMPWADLERVVAAN